MIFRPNCWSAHLLIAVTVSYCLGISLSRATAFPYGSSQLSIWPLLAIALTANHLRYRRLAVLTLLLTFLVLGMVYGDRAAYPRLESTHLVHTVGDGLEAVIIGRLEGTVTTKNNTSKARLAVSHIRSQPDGPFASTEGIVLIGVRGVWPEHIRPGDQVIVRATLYPPPISNTPGTFNYREYLSRDSIFITGTVTHPVLISAIKHAPSPPARFTHAIERVRSHIGDTIDSHLPRPASSIYKALLIGDRTGIAPETMDIFKKTGTMHLLAVSGMHTGLIATALFLLINWGLRRSTFLVVHCNLRKVSLLATIPPLCLYALLTGAQPPVVRSVIMLGVFVFAFSINRLHHPLHILTTAALCILLYDPTALFSASFQLSFVAVASLLVGIRRIPVWRFLGNDGSWARKTGGSILATGLTIGAVTVVATVGTIPLMLHHFNYISPFTLPANLLIQPLICFWSLPVGIVSAMVSLFAPELSAVAFQAGAVGINTALSIGSLFADNTFSQVWFPGPSLTACVVYYCGLILLVLDIPPGNRLFLSVPLLLFSVLSMFHLYDGPVKTPHDRWSISVLDVGHGSANVVEMSNGYIALIDGGAQTAPGYDCGERTIAPFLWHRRVARVNDIIITHDDADHYNGIPAIIERFRPERLFLPPVEQPKSGLRRVIEYAKRFRVSIIIPEQSITITQADETLTLILAAATDSNGHGGVSGETEDDSGLLAHFVSGRFSMLFPGDISDQKEQDLVNSGTLGDTTVLLSAHHGSSTSNSYGFFEALSPDYLIFSSGGRHNPLFPSRKAIENAARLGIETCTTALDGTVRIVPERINGYRVETYNRSTWLYYRRNDRNNRDIPRMQVGSTGLWFPQVSDLDESAGENSTTAREGPFEGNISTRNADPAPLTPR